MPGALADSANPAWSADGTKLAFSSDVSGHNQIYTVNADGSGRQLVVADSVGAIDPTWSPTGTALAFSSIRTGRSQIYVVQLGTGAVTQLTTDASWNQQPRWSPTGNLIAFASVRTGSFRLYTMNPDGSNQQLVLGQQPGSDTDPAWSPDGTQLAYTAQDPASRTSRIYTNSLSGSPARAVTLGFGGTDDFPAWSPDGKAILFSRNGSLYVVPSTGETDSNLVGPLGGLGTLGVDAVWAPAQSPPVVASVSGKVTATQPTSSTVAVNQPTPVETGTLVNAQTGKATVAFTPVVSGVPSTQSSIAQVAHAVFHVAKRSSSLLSLSLNPPKCPSTRGRASARTADYLPPVVRVRHGHFRVITHQAIAASHGTTYTVVYGCTGTTVTVSSGVVILTLRHPRRGQRKVFRITAGHHRTVKV